MSPFEELNDTWVMVIMYWLVFLSGVGVGLALA